MSELEDRFGTLPEPAMNLFYLLSLRLAATDADVDEILAEGDELVIRFRERRAVDTSRLARGLGVPIQARANQVRFPRGRGTTWMPVLREIVDRLAATPTG
jgi:transcription-repair coupling factor (superfamily II helicase)